MASEALGLLPGEMQEQFYRQGRRVCRKCRSNFIARDGVYAENAGAIFGECLDGSIPKNEGPLLWTSRVCRKCRSNFRRVPGWQHPEKRRPAALDIPGMLKTQEQFPVANRELPPSRFQ
jgi:ribosomal protein L40E